MGGPRTLGNATPELMALADIRKKTKECEPKQQTSKQHSSVASASILVSGSCLEFAFCLGHVLMKDCNLEAK